VWFLKFTEIFLIKHEKITVDCLRFLLLRVECIPRDSVVRIIFLT